MGSARTEAAVRGGKESVDVEEHHGVKVVLKNHAPHDCIQVPRLLVVAAAAYPTSSSLPAAAVFHGQSALSHPPGKGVDPCRPLSRRGRSVMAPTPSPSSSSSSSLLLHAPPATTTTASGVDKRGEAVKLHSPQAQQVRRFTPVQASSQVKGASAADKPTTTATTTSSIHHPAVVEEGAAVRVLVTAATAATEGVLLALLLLLKRRVSV
jgi:hypothetical protein